jgi:hypothetical protein
LGVASTGIIIFINLADSRNVFCAISGDYRSLTSGNWNATATWQTYNGSAWIAASATPTSANGVITILTGHTVTVTAAVTVDQVIINSGGVIAINTATTMTLANGTGTDLDVTGILKSAGTVTISASATIVYQSGGKYQHNFTTSAGTIPAATWSSGSTCEVIGYTTNTAATAGVAQSFYDFTWNCPSQTAKVTLTGLLATVTNNFAMTSTGTGSLRLATAQSTTLTVSGNFTQTAGTIYLNTTGSETINVTGNYLLSGGSFNMTDASSGNPILNVTGNFTISNGTFNLSSYASGTAGLGIGTLNLYGNFSLTGGTLTETAASVGYGTIFFKKTGTQTFTFSGGTLSNSIDFTVNSGSLLSPGTDIITGRNFTLSSGGAIYITSPAGITSSGATGGVQSTGTRTLSTGGDYFFIGSSAQVTGSGFPSTVDDLTLNNSNGLTLSATTSVSNNLTLTSGKITTGSYELQVTNSATTSITGHSSSDYIIGNLRRTVSSSGAYVFPLGTSANYELATITLSSTTGFTTILGRYTNTNPLTVLQPLINVLLGALTIDHLIDYGYWTMTPNSVLLTGTYGITLNSKGGTSPSPGSENFCVLKRATSLLPWQSVGTHVAGTVGATITEGRTGLTSFSDFAMGYYDSGTMTFTGETLVSGSDGQVGATYKFPNVFSGVDAWIQILELSNGASLNAIDDFTSGNGYDEGWQPFINCAPNCTSSVNWKIMFKKAATATDTVISHVYMTAVDIDGDGGTLREFVEITWPYSYAVDPGCNLTITHNDFYRATADYAGLANIDTSQKQAMFQANFQNVSNFNYRTGVISTKAGSDVRQNAIYFHSFFSGNTALPIKLIYFNAKLKSEKVDLTWATAAEINNNFFTVERSADGKNFERLLTKPGAGNSTRNLYYSATDENPLTGYSYYRLKQTDYDGKFSYSAVQTIKSKGSADDDESAIKIQSIGPNPFTESFKVNFMLKEEAIVNIMLINSSGQIVHEESFQSTDGYNTWEFIDQHGLPKGIYFVNLVYNEMKVSQKVMKN